MLTYFVRQDADGYGKEEKEKKKKRKGRELIL